MRGAYLALALALALSLGRVAGFGRGVASLSMAAAASPAAPPMITIRGGPAVQRLPMSYVKTWPIYTFDATSATFEAVENEQSPAGEGWVNPTSFKDLFLPADLPLPKALPALGVCLANGVPRFLMPSLCLSLETPARSWRNRGVSSAPRAAVWIDLFALPGAGVGALRLSVFGQSVQDVRFLEDIDGAAAWESVLYASGLGPGTGAGPGFGPGAGFGAGAAGADPLTLPVSRELAQLREALLALPDKDPALWQALSDGYAFVDVPLCLGRDPAGAGGGGAGGAGGAAQVAIPRLRLRALLCDFDRPDRLLALTNPGPGEGSSSGGSGSGGSGSPELDGEAVGELSVEVVPVGAGSESEFLPEVYRDLYEGNVLL